MVPAAYEETQVIIHHPRPGEQRKIETAVVQAARALHSAQDVEDWINDMRQRSREFKVSLFGEVAVTEAEMAG
jgi:hypothetical protein